MRVVKTNELRDNLKSICDRVIGGEVIVVSRPHSQNVVVISEDEYYKRVRCQMSDVREEGCAFGC